MITTIKAGILAALVSAGLAGAATVSGVVRASGQGPGGGAALQGAKVVLVAFRQNGGGNGTPVDSTQTNAQGQYAFDSVATGFYQVQASLAGYQNGSAVASVQRQNQEVVANITLTRTGGFVQRGTIIGRVQQASTLEAVNNATLVLARRNAAGALVPQDTAKSDGEGRFVFDSVAALANYVVTASAAGYVSQSANNVDVTAGDTTRIVLNLSKEPTPNSKIVGRVGDASDSGKALAGATVVLRRRAGTAVPFVWEARDTIVTGPDGLFAFANLPATTVGSPYSIVVTKADYETFTSANLVVGPNETDTVNVRLVRIAKGGMSIFVGQDTAGRPPLKGASVVAVLQGGTEQEYTGTTDDKGWVNFPTVIAGSYLVTVGLSGYVSENAMRTVQANEKDTGFVYLARATAGNSKTLSGLVRDASGKPVAGADVLFESAGGMTITLHAIVSSTGDYKFEGIPSNVGAGRVTVEAEGYAQQTVNVTLSGASSFLNVTLQKSVSVRFQAGAADGFRLREMAGATVVEFASPAKSGRILVYDGKGALAASVTVPEGARRVVLPGSASARKGRFVVLDRR